MATTQPARVPAEEAATHLRQMRGALRRLVGAARVGDPVDESTHLGHAVELHAGEIARSADQLLRLRSGARVCVRSLDCQFTQGFKQMHGSHEVCLPSHHRIIVRKFYNAIFVIPQVMYGFIMKSKSIDVNKYLQKVQ